MEMSIAVMISSVRRSNFSTSTVSSSHRNFSKLMLVRLQDELSRWTSSLHELPAVIRLNSGQECQRLMVPSYWMPGSAHAQAARAILQKSSLESNKATGSPVVREASSKD